MPSPPRLQQVRISDQVADHIVRYIADNRLEAGQSLPSESELTRLFGVSRPTVREATNALAGRGLIAVSSGRSPTVLALSKSPFSNPVRHGLATQQLTPVQILEVRRSLETQAVEMAAANRTPQDIERIRAIVEQMPDAVGDIDAFSPLDAAFHETLGQATGNPLLSVILSGIGDITFESSRSGLARARDAQAWAFVLAVHQRIAAAVVKGQVAVARREMLAHFKTAVGRYAPDEKAGATGGTAGGVEIPKSPRPRSRNPK